MDIPRSAEVKQQRKRRRIVYSVLGAVVVLLATLCLSRLKPAPPSVERSTVWTDTVKRGPMLREVRGNGSLVPEDVRWIPAETDSRVERIRVLPGTPVEADTIIMDLSNPELEQQAMDADWQLRAAEAEYKNARVKVEGDLMNQQASAATVGADYSEAQRRAQTDEELAKLGVIS